VQDIILKNSLPITAKIYCPKIERTGKPVLSFYLKMTYRITISNINKPSFLNTTPDEDELEH